MKTREIIKKPDYIGTLRQIEVGDTQIFELVGTTYNAMLTARNRLRGKNEGEWLFEIDSTSNEMKVIRTS